MQSKPEDIMSGYEISIKKFPGYIYVLCISQTTTDRFSKELKLTDISGLPDYQDTIEKVYEMLEHIIEGDDKNIETIIIENGVNPQVNDDVISKCINNTLICTFTHKLYGFKIQFTLDKISDDIKAERRIKQLEDRIEELEKVVLQLSIKYDAMCNELIQKKDVVVEPIHKPTTLQLGSALKHMPHIDSSVTELTLDRVSCINDLSMLSSLLLTSLTINECPYLKDISSLSSMPSLTELTIKMGSSRYTRDISPLSSMTSLTKLTISGLELGHMPTISSMTSLTDLTISPHCDHHTKNISFISSLTALTTLNISTSGCYSLDVSSLNSLLLLTELTITSIPVHDNLLISSLTTLTTLNINNCSIRNLTPISSLLSLTTLEITNNHSYNLDDLSPLYKLVKLHTLDLTKTKVSASNISTLKSHLPNCNVIKYDII
jgi:hypothetical protein